jgi:hypothetical protein
MTFETTVDRYGRRHRISGIVFLVWLVAGYVEVAVDFGIYTVVYDFLLSVLGLILTLTAAYDFKEAHKRVTNRCMRYAAYCVVFTLVGSPA